MKRKLAPELQQEIRAIIEDMLQGYEFEIRSIKVDEVWSGDESNFVELWYQLNQHEFDPRLIGSGMSD